MKCLAKVVNEFETIKKRKRRVIALKRLLLTGGLIVIAMISWHFKDVLIYFTDMVTIGYRSAKQSTSYPRRLFSEQPIRLENFNGNVLLVSENNATVYSVHNAAKLFTLRHSFSNGRIRQNSGRIAVFDYSGGNLQIYDRFRRAYTEQKKQTIYGLALADDGSVAVMSASPHYASCARVISPKNKQIFKWECADSYVADAAFSPNSQEIAITSLATANGVINSSVKTFEISTGKLKAQYSTPDLIYDIFYPYSDRVVVVTRNQVYFMNSNLKVIYSYEFASRELSKFAHSDDHIILNFASYQNGVRSALVMLNSSGKVLGEVEAKGAIKSLKADKNGAGFLTDERLILLDRNLKVKKVYRCNIPIYDFVCIGNNLIVASSDQLIKLKV